MRRLSRGGILFKATKWIARHRLNSVPHERSLGSSAVLLLPALVALALLYLAPMFLLVLTSFHRSLGIGRVGDDFTFANYVEFLGDPFYLNIVFTTLWLGVLVAAICLLLAFPVAYFLARTRTRWRGSLIFLVVAPLLISLVIRNLGFLPILGTNGLVNRLLIVIGAVNEPLALIGFTGVVVGLVHALLPFMILTLTTVIQRIEVEIEEASISLGAGPFRTFWYVVLPLSRPGLIAGSILVFTLAISAYTTPAMLGGNKVIVMSTYIAQQVLLVMNNAFGATAAVILTLAAVGIALFSLSGRHEKA